MNDGTDSSATSDASGDASKRPDATDAERSIRDLMGLLALPALWAGRSGQSVLEIMTEAIERIVPLRFTYSHAMLLRGEPACHYFRVGGRPLPDEKVAEWEEAVSAWPQANASESKGVVLPTPLGDMTVVRFNLKYKAGESVIWFGSNAPGFPTMPQLAFLRAAVSLAASGIETARISHEREEAARAKDEFLAMLGHELRNPLAPIVTALELLKLKSSQSLPREYTIIERQVLHLNRLVDDLLDVSRITGGKITLQRAPLDLKTVLKQAAEEAQSLFAIKRHTLTIDLPSAPIRVFGDEVRLKQVFTNLLINAGKYTDLEGRIKLMARIQQGRVSVSIRDNGIGIPSQLFPRLFTIFEQGSASIARSGGGLGIGLAIVKSFVELHEGTVVASSEGVGRGAEFIVSLPLFIGADQGQDKTGANNQQPSSLQRVLIVDDNADALEALASFLNAKGYEVETSHDAVTALKVAEWFQPKVAVLDIGLPLMDGYQLAAALRQRFAASDLRLIALTGYGQKSDIQRAMAAGFEAHLVKPVRLEELITAMTATTESVSAALKKPR